MNMLRVWWLNKQAAFVERWMKRHGLVPVRMRVLGNTTYLYTKDGQAFKLERSKK